MTESPRPGGAPAAASSDIRLVVMDVDGTLVDDEKRVPAPNQRALRAALERGVHVAIASGRMVASIERLEKMLGLDCALIAYNGGKVVGPTREGRSCIVHRPLPHAVALTVLEFARRHGHLLNYYVDDVLYAEPVQSSSRFAEIYSRRTGSQYHFRDLDEVSGAAPTKLILLGEPEELIALRERFASELAGRVNVVITDPEYLEFMDVGVDKSTALPALAGYYGLDVRHVLAIGDADNDRGMIAAAGLGIAVANARPSVLGVARHVTRRDNNAGAVAEAIERWVLGEGAVPGLWE